ncbi:MAG: DNA polymerase I [Ruminococcaceae bacterium]|nr:DNA polymerase I [Oscillospiraceae bacterium]
MKKLLCIDGNSIINRSFYGVRPLTTKDGFPTNALYGFVNIVNRQIENVKPDYAAVAFDLKAPTFRHKMYAEYKAGRHAMPDELAAQMPESKVLAEAMGLHTLSLEGYEADDILGTLARMAEESEEECTAYILTGDKDALQLISPRVHVLLATNSDTLDMDEAAFLEKYGVPSSSFVDVKALMGDSSDNIPGVSGIGEKTALKLISEYGSLDGIYASLSTAKHTPSLRAKLEGGRESAYTSQTLARIYREVPLEKSLSDIAFHGAEKIGLRRLFLKYEFSGFIKRFGLEDVAEATEISFDANKASDSACTCSAAETISSDDLIKLSDGLYSVDAKECDGHLHVLIFNGERLYDYTHDNTASLAQFLCRGGVRTLCFDAKSLYKLFVSYGISGFEFYADVMLAAYVINSGMDNYAPDRLVISYLKETQSENIPLAVYIFRMWEIMSNMLEETRQSNVFFDIEMPLSSVLADIELEGFKIDRAKLYEYGVYLDEVASQLEERIYTYAGREFNINSPKQLGEVLFDEMMLPADKKTKTGYSTSAEVLERLRKYHPIIEDILDYRQLTKLKSTYVDGLLKVADENGRIHTTFKQTGTATGRLSSAEPNLQNIPIRTELGREMRKFFIPSDSSKVLIDADYSQIELRLLAEIAGDNAMREAFVSGTDIHTSTAMRIFGVDKDDVTIDLRKRAKAVNFGIMYGMGEYSLSQDLHIPVAEAKAYIARYLGSYPDIDKYLKDIIKSAYDNGYVTTLLGRRRYIPELSNSKKMLQKFGERVAMNSPIQGTAADIMKIAMVRIHKKLKDSGIKAKLILQVHDELIIEADREAADSALAILKSEMESAVKCNVPLDVEAHIGENWFEAH